MATKLKKPSKKRIANDLPPKVKPSRNPHERTKKRYYQTPVTLPFSEFQKYDLSFYGSGFSQGSNNAHLTFLRRMAIENPYVRSYLHLLKNGVVGHEPIRPTFSNIANRKQAKMLKELWQDYEMDVGADGRTTMRQLQKQLVEQFAVDGRVLIVARMDDAYNQGLAVQPMSRENLSVNSDDNRNIRNGVEYDTTTGRIIQYHFQSQQKPYGISQYLENPITIPARLVFDLKNKSRPDNWDDYNSMLYAAVKSVKQVDDIDDSTLKAMKSAACKMGFIEQTGNEPTTPADEYENLDSTTGFDTDLPERMAYGTIDVLAAGQKFAKFDPAWPNVNSSAYRKDMLRAGIASMGGDYNSVCNDSVSVNYNSLRHMTLQVRDNYRAMQKDMVDMFMRPFVKMWLQNAQMNGYIKLSRADMMVALRTPYESRTYPWVDPVKDTKARLDQLKMGALSLKDVAQEGGKSVENVLQENKEVIDMMEEIGMDKLKMALAIFGGNKDLIPDDDDDDDESLNAKPESDE